MPLILGAASAAAAGGYDIDNSCRFNGDAYLHKTLGTPTNRNKWTTSVWFKKCDVDASANRRQLFQGHGGSTDYTGLVMDDSGGRVDFGNRQGSHVGRIVTNRQFQDPMGWYHVVTMWDSTESVAGDRMKLYVNGVEITSFATDTNPALNEDCAMASGDVFYVGGHGGTSYQWDGYMAELVFCDGQAYAASDFGEFSSDSSSIWIPKDPSGLTFGANGFWLDFEDSANLGNDANGGTDLTEVGLAAGDQAVDTPTNNFCTWNPLWTGRNPQSTYGASLDEGNVNWSRNDDTGVGATFALTKGKWYFESKATVYNNYTSYYWGLWNTNLENGGSNSPGYNYFTQTDGGSGIQQGNNYLLTPALSNISSKVDGTNTADYSTNKCDVGDIIGMAIDLDAGDLEFYNTNTSIATAMSLTTTAAQDRMYIVTANLAGSAGDMECNFGGCPGFTDSATNTDENGYGKFVYAPPSGFLAMCSKNLGSDGG